MVMDGSQLIESLDFLWFFSNVLSLSSAQHSGSFSDENTTKNHDQVTAKEEPPRPMSPTLQTQQIESRNDESLESPKSPTCGDFAAEIVKPTMVQPCVVEMVEEFADTKEKKEKRRKRSSSSSKRRKRSGGLCQRREILGQLDLGFERKMVYGSWDWETCEYYRSFGGQHNLKMPPLNDGMAMKEHLKSWAYAVACTVR